MDAPTGESEQSKTPKSERSLKNGCPKSEGGLLKQNKSEWLNRGKVDCRKTPKVESSNRWKVDGLKQKVNDSKMATIMITIMVNSI